MRNPEGTQPIARKKTKGKGKVDNGEEDEEDVGANGKSVPELLLANKWDFDTGPDPTGWWISEKLDGVRWVSLGIVYPEQMLTCVGTIL